MKEEIELKLEMAPEVLERLRRHPAIRAHRQGRAVTRSLDNTYYDTPDLRLAALGASLRVRRSGRQRLQTVKLRDSATQGGHFDRQEWEEPLRSEAPTTDSLAATPLPGLLPAEALDSLRPVFTTRFRRTTYRLAGPEGAAAPAWEIDLTLDSGAVEAEDRCAPLVEAELELARGRPADLYRLARQLCEGLPVRLGIRSKADRGYDLARPAPPQVPKAPKPRLGKGMTTADGFHAIGVACLRHYLAAEAVLHRERAPEAIHQMRVALRRLRSAMTLFAPLVGTAEGRRLKDEVKWLAGELGDARDLDVFLHEVLDPVRAENPDDAGLARLAALVEARRERAYGRAFAAAGTPRAALVLLDVALWLEDGDWRSEAPEVAARPLRAVAAETLARRAAKVAKAGKGFRRLNAEQRHRVRIEVKKLRYAVDFFRPLFKGKAVAAYQAPLAGLQETLGGLNDIAVAHALLHRLAQEAEATAGGKGGGQGREVAFAAGVVSGWHDRAARGLLDDAGAAWKAFRAAKPFWTG